MLEPPRDHEYGHRTLFFKDPEGNILEIYADISLNKSKELLLPYSPLDNRSHLRIRKGANNE